MSGGKLDTRQRMINMMYLVLIAIMALNVSREILDSFITIDKGQNTTRHTLEEKTALQMAVFESRLTENPKKFQASYDKASTLRQEANELIEHIDRMKAQCIMETEGLDLSEVYDSEVDTVLDIRYVNKKDAYDAVTNVLYGVSEEPAVDSRAGDEYNFRAAALRDRLQRFEERISSSVASPSVKASAAQVFSFAPAPDADGDMRDWEYVNFYHVPLAATQSILSKIQSDIRTVEADAVSSLFAEVEGPTMKFNRLKEAVIPVSRDITIGGTYQAEIFLAAYDELNPPEIRLGDPGVKVDPSTLELLGDYSIVAVDSSMIGNLTLDGDRLGEHKREGVIVFKPTGLPEVRKPFVIDYTVTAPTLVASPTNMNVFYRAIDNPLSLSVPGYQDRDLTASIDNGSLRRAGDGRYIVNVTEGTTANVSVVAVAADGSQKRFGPSTFRVKSVPDPIATFGGKGPTDKTISKAQLRAAGGLAAVMKDFEFPVEFKVTSFTITAKPRGEWVSLPSRGNRLSGDQIEMLKSLGRGKRLNIEDIVARGPDGRPRPLPSLSLRVVD